MIRRPVAVLVLAPLALATAAAAHLDDPKEKEILPAYVGPGYRAGLDGLGGSPFHSSGVRLTSWLPVGEFGTQDWANDCWGYTAPSGREYAIIGLSDGTGFVEITDPELAVVVAVIPGLHSTWRDIKTFGSWAYAVTEASSGGIQVIDLAGIDDGVVTLHDTIMVGGSTKSHNVAIDETSGFLYRAGGDGNGLRVYDLNPDPSSPTFVGEWNVRYVHDVQVVTMTSGPWAGHQIAFACSGFNNGWVETGLDILDVTTKSDIVDLGHIVYDNGAYSHQCWLSEDAQHLFLNDEADEDGVLPTTTLVFDVSDLTAPSLVTTFTNGNLAVGHNLYVRGDLVLEANYASGLRVFDASDPLNATEVAWFDTHPEDDNTSYQGLWSNFPYFPSGTIIGSDRQRGLFVWELTLPDPADVNGDGVVNFADILELIAAWGACPLPPADCPADVNGSGAVDFADILLVLGAWS